MRSVNKEKAPEDGLSWLLDYVCRLLKTYPSFTPEYVWDALDMMQGWAYYAWAMENDGWLQFAGIARSSKGYVGAEVDNLIEIAHKVWAEKKE